MLPEAWPEFYLSIHNWPTGEQAHAKLDMDIANENAAPLFSAVSGSTRQLFHLLRCINFVPKANVQITKNGIRFTVEESQVMQGAKTLLILFFSLTLE